MKIFKPNSPVEKALQKIEALMYDEQISLDWDGFRFRVSFEGKDVGFLIDTENQLDAPRTFPRFLESERVCCNID